MCAVNTAALILAAGASRRLGRPKQTVLFHGESLLDRAVRLALDAGLTPVLVVVPEAAPFAKPLRNLRCIVFENPAAGEGIASSIRTGIDEAMRLKVPGIVVMACDQPALTAVHLRALCDAPEQTTGSAYAGRVGIPAYFPASSFPSLLTLTGDTGARDLLRQARPVTCEALSLDIDTDHDLSHANTIQFPA
jgi:molybdenum cofactor cytidylyltransferase